MNIRLILATAIASFSILVFTRPAAALNPPDPGAVSSEKLSLPSGPASIRGLSDNPTAATFSAQIQYSVPVDLPRAASGFGPQLQLKYSGALGNSAVGVGWYLDEVVIRRSLRHGVPTYTDQDTLELIGIGEGRDLISAGDGTYRVLGSGNQIKIERFGDGFIVHSPTGVSYYLGVTSDGRQFEGDKTSAWFAEEVVDEAKQSIKLKYFRDQGRLYLKTLLWGPGDAFRAELTYGPRPDQTLSYQTGFAVTTAQRLGKIDVWAFSSLLRSLLLTYDESLPLSRLKQIVETGRDGAGALPPLTFGYGQPSPAKAQALGNVGGWALNVRGVSVLDVDGDGMGDLLRTEAGGHSYRRNLGGAFADPVPVTGVASAGFQDVSFLDIDGDARPELVRVVSDTWRVYRLNGGNWSSVGVQPGSYLVPLRKTGMVLVDLNGDGLADHVTAVTSGLQIRFGTATGLTNPVSRSRIDPANPGVDVGQNNVRFHDVNGDGLVDVVWLNSSWMKVYYGRGDGTFQVGERRSYPWGDAVFAPQDVMFADLNRDGFTDLLRFAAGNLHWHPGRAGFQFDTVSVDVHRPDNVDYDATVAVADLNGNGSQDVVWSTPAGIWMLDFAGPTTVAMLNRVENGLGKVVSIDYVGSATLAARASAAGHRWNQLLPVSVPVPIRVQITTGTADPPRVTEYEVRDGFWDGQQREFGGFLGGVSRALGATPDNTLVEETEFLAGLGDDRPLRGRAAVVQKKDGAGRVFDIVTNDWELRAVTGLASLLLRKAVVVNKRTQVYEGASTPIETLMQYSFDSEARTTEENHSGRLDIQGDEKVLQWTYASDDRTWIRDKVIEEKVLTAAGVLVSDKRLLYGDENEVLPFGEVGKGWTRQIDRLLVEASGPRWVTSERSTYDALGNVVAIYASGVTRSFGYDLNGLHIVSEQVEPEPGRTLSWSAEWDNVLGLATAITDPNGLSQRLTYDALGRLSSLALGDAVPHVTYEYLWSGPFPRTITHSFDGASEAIKDRSADWDSQARWRDTVVVSNGMGEPIYNATRLDTSRWIISRWKERDSRGQVTFIGEPFYYDGDLSGGRPGNATNGQSFGFDALGRQIEATLPSGSTTRTRYGAFAETVLTDGYAPVTSALDGLDRIVHTERTVGGQREWVDGQYDAADRLVGMTLQGGAVSHRFTYDTLGRLVQADDPDIGHRELRYDDRDLLVDHINGAGQVVHYDYDAAGRIVRATPADGRAMVYHYDVPKDGGTSARALSRLAWVEEDTGELHLQYDEFGRTRSMTRVVMGVSAEEATRYGMSGLVLGKEYDDGFKYDVDYDAAGRAVRYGSYWQAARLDASGRCLEESYGNGVREVIDRDVNGMSHRIQVVRPSGAALYDILLTRNAYGGVTAVQDTDGVGLDHTSTFEFDDAGRLTSASTGRGAGAYQFRYAYDGLQSMVRREATGPKDIGVLTGDYNHGERGRGPRQLTSIVGASRSMLLDYDQAGRLVRRGDSQLSYDALDRLTRASLSSDNWVEYQYGHEGLRTVARDSAGGTQYWFGQGFSERNGSREHYVEGGSQPIAKVTLQAGSPMAGGVVNRIRRIGPAALVLAPFFLFALLGVAIAITPIVPQARKHRRRLLAALGLPALLPGCWAAAGPGARNDAVRAFQLQQVEYFHEGFAAGPALMTREDGSVLEERRYESFGQPIDAYRETASGGLVTTVDYLREPRNGLNKETDPRTGFSFHGARWMSPDVAMWISPDPPVKGPEPKFMRSPWDLHPYQYVRQNPLLYWDPDGKKPKTVSSPVVSPQSIPKQAATTAAPAPTATPSNQPQYATKANPNGDRYPVEFCHRDADLPGKKVLHLQHWWLRSPDFERGMGPDNGTVPGHGGKDSPYVSKTKITDHTGEGSKPGNNAECIPTGQVNQRYTLEDRSCLMDMMKLGRDTGTWRPTNQCHTAVMEALEECRIPEPPPAHISDVSMGVPYEDMGAPASKQR